MMSETPILNTYCKITQVTDILRDYLDNYLNNLIVRNNLICDPESYYQYDSDITHIEQVEALLKEEIHKLEHNELVIAIIGTMKSGKSSVINALVGKQIIPSRNLPMTIMPTLVRHTLGNQEPNLTFSLTHPIAEIISEIKERMVEETYKKIFSSFISINDTAFSELFYNFDPNITHYTGTNEIKIFLSFINDLIRLALLLDIQFPFDSYNNIYDFPIVDVEFKHLNNNYKNSTISFLDTPGPNEALNNEILHSIINKQLINASALLLIINYSEISSEAEEHVRKIIFHNLQKFNKRISVFVNKFDEKDSNSLSAEETINHIYNKLLLGQLDKEFIFPISVKYADLANHMFNEISSNGDISASSMAQPWFAEFCTRSFGLSWNDEIIDKSKLLSAANMLWKKSGISRFIENILFDYNDKSVRYSIESAVSLTNDYFFRIVDPSFKNCLSIIDKCIADYDNIISKLQTMIDELEAFNNEIFDILESAVESDEEVHNIFSITFEKFSNITSDYATVTESDPFTICHDSSFKLSNAVFSTSIETIRLSYLTLKYMFSCDPKVNAYLFSKLVNANNNLIKDISLIQVYNNQQIKFLRFIFTKLDFLYNKILYLLKNMNIEN
jgi:GTPase Era involved in 16S rRNA processing